MRFGIFYEMQLPRPWAADDERRLGYDYAQEVEHYFLDEYSHSSAPEVFLAAAAARTAEALTTLDIISNGRVDFGIGEGATRLELGGFGIKAKDKRAMALEAALARKLWMQPLAPADIPVVRASVVQAQFNQTRGTGKA